MTATTTTTYGVAANGRRYCHTAFGATAATACSIVSSKCNKRMCVCVYAGVFTEMLSSKWVKHFVAAYLCCCCRCCCWLAVGMCLACGMHYYASRMPQLEIVTFNHHLTISQRSKYVCAAMIRRSGWKSAAQTVKRLVPNHCWASFSHICVNFASFHSIWAVNQLYLSYYTAFASFAVVAVTFHSPRYSCNASIGFVPKIGWSIFN